MDHNGRFPAAALTVRRRFALATGAFSCLAGGLVSLRACSHLHWRHAIQMTSNNRAQMVAPKLLISRVACGVPHVEMLITTI